MQGEHSRKGRELQKQLTKERTLMEESNNNNESKPAYTEEQVREAVKIVNQAIGERRRKLEKITRTNDNDYIELDGETSRGYPCRVLADPHIVANILLEYDYPVWSVLGEEAPTKMWEELAREFGMDLVMDLDI